MKNKRNALFSLVAIPLLITGYFFIPKEDKKECNTEVKMTNDLDFAPKEVRVQRGETVVWTNPSDLVHTVTCDKSKAVDPSHVHLPANARPFDSGTIQPGGRYSYTFTVPGRYKYFCIPHEMSGMIGTVIVE